MVIAYICLVLTLWRTLSMFCCCSSIAKSCLNLWLHGLQHSRLPCPSLSPGVCTNSHPLNHWCHPTILSSVAPFSSYLQSFPASGFFPVSQLFASGSQSIAASYSASVLPKNIQGSFSLGLILCFTSFSSHNISSVEEWRRQWHPTPVLLPGKSHGQRSLVGCNPWGGCSPWGRWVGHNWATSLSLFTFMHWRRKWQPTPVFLPGESQEWRSLVGCRLWGRTESDMTEAT